MGVNIASNYINEEKFTSYLMKNPQNSHVLDFNFLLDFTTRTICGSIDKLQKDGLTITIDELYDYVRQSTDGISKEVIQKIYDSYSDFSNIDYVVDRIKLNYVSNKLNIDLLEDLLVDLSPTGELKLEKLENFSNKVRENITHLKGKSQFLTTTELSNKYRSTLQKRNEGLQRDLGYQVIKDACPRQAEEGEMTLLFGPSGAGKSALAQNMQASLISKGVPVIKFGTEMTIDSEMDRTLAMRLNVSPSEFYKKNRDDKFNSKIERALLGFSRIKNYLHVDESNLTLQDISSLIMLGKEHFRREGVYKNGDEYTLIVIDLASMIKEISGEYGEGVEKGANELHLITKENNIHTLLVVQANENRFRGGMRFKTPEEIDHYVFVGEDIKGGSGWKERCRMVFSMIRPLLLKKQYFPDRIEEWNLETDIIQLHCFKNNNGPEFRIPFVFNLDSFRILPYYIKKPEEVIIN